MGVPSGMELVVIVVVILLLFGGKKIPELAKGLGSGIKNFKNALNSNENEVEAKVVHSSVQSDSTIKKEENLKV
ncbi:twin-arginine translocase TatA/TatE family subunit [Arcobacter sp. FWKO B]|uniref:twin-arginine translocase TatA/TatE family subunit n=1 Tax=Arcobacter sp. FWKO B TaxID=2593672 RepID=UPI0018A50F9A|nr:twin-arginine translocase TatA/TatE family subunit [Arcobacter sp. FWKO B]QOG13013.1 twin-arginine translocase TatA/TatE family subunit [Arcobacter sp. FWKO B]